jgi:hypothetical protein
MVTCAVSWIKYCIADLLHGIWIILNVHTVLLNMVKVSDGSSVNSRVIIGGCDTFVSDAVLARRSSLQAV